MYLYIYDQSEINAMRLYILFTYLNHTDKIFFFFLAVILQEEHHDTCLTQM